MPRPAGSTSDLLLSPAQMRAFLRDEVLPALYPEREITVINRKHVSYTSAHDYRALYSLRFADHPRTWPRFAMVTVGAAEKVGPIYAAHYGGDNGESRSGHVYLHPSGGCMVEFFPSSWKLPSLALALDPLKVAALLHDGPGETDQEASVEVLRFRPHKSCVIRYVFGSQPASRHELIGKLYATGPKARMTWQKLNAFYDQAPALGIAVPKPVQFVNDWDFILMEPVAGDRFKDALKASETEEQMKRAARTAANGLAAFQRLHVDTEESRTLPLLLSKLRKRAARIAGLAPDVAHRVEPLIDRAGRLAERLPEPTLSTIHGDYKPSQVFVDGHELAIVDLDRACLGDRALDVGSFLAVLHKKRMQPKREHYAILAGAFLTAYLENVSEPGLPERARVAESISLVRMALGKFESLTHGDVGEAGEERATRLLEEAAACLAGL